MHTPSSSASPAATCDLSVLPCVPLLQVLIYKWVPIVGPILGSAFVIGLYIAARLLRGDLTDRMKLMDEGEEKRRRTALKEARIAFLEEEIPALVARQTDISVIKCVPLQRCLGEPAGWEVSLSLYMFCLALLLVGSGWLGAGYGDDQRLACNFSMRAAQERPACSTMQCGGMWYITGSQQAAGQWQHCHASEASACACP